MPQLFRKILVPHDFSNSASNALKVAASLAAAHRGRLTVLHVIYPYPMTGLTPAEGVPFIPPADLVPDATASLEAVVRRVLPRRGAPKVVCRVVVGHPAQQILEAARQADSVVMGTEGRTGLSHLLIGSVAEKVVRHSPRPVLTVRAGTRARKGAGRRARRTRRRGRRAARRPARVANRQP